MATIKAFNALRYTPTAGITQELVCPPYDIISEEERLAYLSKNEHNIIRLELPRDGQDPYKTAGDTLNKWLNDNIVDCDSAPGLYIYEEEFTAMGECYKVKGLMCRVKLEPFENGVVLPHEETLSKAKTDRFNLMCATGCNFSSIYSLYFDEQNSIFSQINSLSQGKPDVSFTLADGIKHNLWCVYDEEKIAAITKAFADKKLYIADGHHRYETALNYKKHLEQQGVNNSEDHPANFCMMTLVNMENPGLVVFPTHRIVRGLENFNSEKILAECAKYFDVSETGDAEAALAKYAAENKKAFVMYDGQKQHLLALKDIAVMDEILPGTSPAYRNLDVNVLHNLILEKLLGIDKENMANQKNLTYTRDLKEAFESVDNKTANCAFIINATKVAEIAAVAGAGEKMPQKSTYFYPKLITGHVMNKIL